MTTYSVKFPLRKRPLQALPNAAHNYLQTEKLGGWYPTLGESDTKKWDRSTCTEPL
jgi:hypothetical protein